MVVNGCFAIFSLITHLEMVNPNTSSNKIFILIFYIIYIILDYVLFILILLNLNHLTVINEITNMIITCDAAILFNLSILVNFNKNILTFTAFFLAGSIAILSILFFGFNLNPYQADLAFLIPSTFTICLLIGCAVLFSYLSIKKLRLMKKYPEITIKLKLIELVPYIAPASLFIIMLVFKNWDYIKDYAGIIFILYLILVYYILFDMLGLELNAVQFSLHIIIFILTILFFYIPI